MMVDGVSTRSDDRRVGVAGVVLSAERVSKRFPGVVALQDVDFEVGAGEIHGLVGHNGAGKSTLVRVLNGVYHPDSGAVRIGAEVRSLRGPRDAQRLGVFTIHQELSLVPSLSVAENIVLGDLPRARTGSVGWRQMAEEATSALRLVGSEVDVRSEVGRLTVGEQQSVELAKALRRKALVVLLDEPTAALSMREVERLFELVRGLKQRGMGLVYISHRLDEVTELCDRVTVMRNGKRVVTLQRGQVDKGRIVEAMLGKELAGSVLARAVRGEGSKLHTGTRTGETLLRVEDLEDGNMVRGVSLALRAGEAVGVTGLIGNGQMELGHLIVGARRRKSGAIEVSGKAVRMSSPREAVRLGIGFLPEDRKTQGLVLGMSVRENVTLGGLRNFTRLGVMSKAKEVREGTRVIKGLGMTGDDLGRTVRELSGGTQQKVVLAKWLATRSRVLVFCEPTRGVDVGAKEELYEIMKTFVDEGGAVLMVTSEIDESVLCDRVLVMARGRVVGEVASNGNEADYEDVKRLCL
jgi:ribose transport system ATP-binding protein